MVFTSFKFLVFLTITVAIYFIVPVKFRGYVLLAASLIFYCIAGIKFLPFILVTTVMSYAVSRKISSIYEEMKKEMAVPENKSRAREIKETYKTRCRKYMIAALVVLLGILAYTKFARMLLAALSSAFGAESLSAISIIVPLGVSYYTFSTVGYVLDVYWQRYEAEKNFFHYALYVIYFPHILQGPIARYDRLGVQLFREHYFDYKRVCFGIQLMLWGYFQKLVIADRLAIFVTAVYDGYADLNGPVLLVATLFYAVQIYADFAGCVNIAMGISQIFDIELEPNFRQPYFSTSVAEYWRRWHMTLGAWFKDYLCMPVAVSGWVKKLSKKVRQKWGRTAGKNTVTIASLIAVWIATGVWHGTGINYILWGCWQGGIIAISTLLEPSYVKWKKALKIDDQSPEWHLFCIVRTFILTAIIPRVITKAPSVIAAAKILKRILTQPYLWQYMDGTLYTFGLDRQNFLLSLVLIVLLFHISLAKERGVQIRETIARQNLVLRWIFYLLAIFSILILGIYGLGYSASSFAYMGF